MTTAPGVHSAVAPTQTLGPDVRREAGPAGTDGGKRSGSAPRRWWRRERSPNPWRAEILARLEKPGCLICREAVVNLGRYYFWFLVEQYANVPTIEGLQRAHGFCLRHTRHLLERRVPDRTSVVARYVLQSCADWLRKVQAAQAPERRGPRQGGRSVSGRLRPLAGCPACEQERQNFELQSQIIVGCLTEVDIATAFRASYGLCLPHFLAAAPQAEWETLQCLVEEQFRHLEQARANLLTGQPRGTDGAGNDALREAMRRLYGPDLDKRIRPFLVAGRRPREAPAARAGDQGTGDSGVPASWSPAFEETRHLLSQPGCSICRVAARGREEYLAWLEEEIRDFTAIHYRWSQMLYLCSEHAWLFADRCAPEVLATGCGHLLEGLVGALRQLLWDIREPIPRSLAGRLRTLPTRWRENRRRESPNHSPPSLSQRIRGALGTLWQTPQDFLDRARARALHWSPCPVCFHLETIEARAADRLLAVVADPDGRRAFEGSYGLCLHHAPLVLERAGAPDLQRDIAAILLARVEVDHWEVEEHLRKQSWSVRHEPKGAEEAAWVRASTRIAGVALERQYGF